MITMITTRRNYMMFKLNTQICVGYLPLLKASLEHNWTIGKHNHGTDNYLGIVNRCMDCQICETCDETIYINTIVKFKNNNSFFHTLLGQLLNTIYVIALLSSLCIL